MLGQALLTKLMGKSRVIAETGAGQHGVATATACALLGLECVVYMGEVDTRRQALNVARMRLLGARVVPVTHGSRTLKDAINEALRDWVTNVSTTHYLLGTVAGPHPFPTMVRDFHRVIGLEAREQVQERTGRLPDAIAACVGGGSNAIGIFHAFLDDPGVRLVGFEPGGDGVETGRHGATLSEGSPGALHGALSYLLQDDDGQTAESYSISAGLDYPGVGPEHALLKDLGRAQYRPVTDAAAMDAFALLSPDRRDHPGDRERARDRRRARPGPRARAGRGDPREPLGARRQGRRHRREVVRDDRRGAERGGRRRDGDRAGPPGLGALPGHLVRRSGRADRRDPAVTVRSVADVFARCAAEGRGALVGYLPAGYPTVDGSVELFTAAIEGGCDLVEVGIPYSDPVMDGPTIQAAADTALRAGFRVRDVFTVVERISAAGGAAVVMTYFNPVLRYGVDAFARDLAAAGGLGVITPDLIPDEADEWLAASTAHGLDRIFLVAPSSTEERIASTAAASSGFLYATSTMGVTGARGTVDTAAAAIVARCRPHTALPIGVGLGVRSGEQAAEVAAFADAVIVGSALVSARRSTGGPDAVRELAAELAAGVRRAGVPQPA